MTVTKWIYFKKHI